MDSLKELESNIKAIGNRLWHEPFDPSHVFGSLKAIHAQFVEIRTGTHDSTKSPAFSVLDASNKEIDRLMAQVVQLRGDCAWAKAARLSAQENEKLAEERLLLALAENDRFQAEESQLRGQKAELAERNERQAKMIAENSGRIEGLKTSLARADQKMAELAERNERQADMIRDRDLEIAKITRMNDRLFGKNDDLKKKLDILIAESNSLLGQWSFDQIISARSALDTIKGLAEGTHLCVIRVNHEGLTDITVGC